MALNAYLNLKGQKQGEIKGSVIQKGREGKIMVIAVSHEIASPRDAASGQASGKRQHKPFAAVCRFIADAWASTSDIFRTKKSCGYFNTKHFDKVLHTMSSKEIPRR